MLTDKEMHVYLMGLPPYEYLREALVLHMHTVEGMKAQGIPVPASYGRYLDSLVLEAHERHEQFVATLASESEAAQ